uniref:BZIP domain-containing protein n=1 Tax=Schistosoma mansoni TaxID=6183 RepID=A0A5K4FCY3_SCHMA
MLKIPETMSVEKFNLPDSSYGDEIDYYVVSPTILQLDHQEIIETDHSSDNPLLNGDSVTQTATTNSNLDLGLNKEADYLFSFELDTHTLPLELLNKDLDSPDFSWTDLLPDSNELVSLDDINPDNFPKSKQIKNEKVKFTNCQRKSLINHFNPMPKFSYQEKTIQQQKLLYSSSSIHSSPSSVNDHHRHHQLFNSTEVNNDLDSSEINNCDMNDSYKTTKGECVKLSSEECKMLQQIGCQLPIKFPLSQTDEKAIRTVRRKIRNKLSAQASRAKRQKYVTDLEHRYSMCTEEIKQLRRQVYELEEDKRSLTLHLRKLRSYINKFMNKQSEKSYLPLYVNSNNTEFNRDNNNNNNKVTAKQAARAAAGGTSLLLMTFMILMWTAIIPMPSVIKTLDTASPMSTINLFSSFPGRSRMLMSINNPSELYSSSSSSSQHLILNESKTLLSDPDIIPVNSIQYTVPISQFVTPVITEQ